MSTIKYADIKAIKPGKILFTVFGREEQEIQHAKILKSSSKSVLVQPFKPLPVEEYQKGAENPVSEPQGEPVLLSVRKNKSFPDEIVIKGKLPQNRIITEWYIADCKVA